MRQRALSVAVVITTPELHSARWHLPYERGRPRRSERRCKWSDFTEGSDRGNSLCSKLGLHWVEENVGDGTRLVALAWSEQGASRVAGSRPDPCAPGRASHGEPGRAAQGLPTCEVVAGVVARKACWIGIHAGAKRSIMASLKWTSEAPAFASHICDYLLLKRSSDPQRSAAAAPTTAPITADLRLFLSTRRLYGETSWHPSFTL